MNTKAKGKAGTHLKTLDDLAHITLEPSSHHVLSYEGEQGGQLSITREDKGEVEGADITVLIDGKPKQMKPGDAHTVEAQANGNVEIASTSGGDFILSAKTIKAPKEDAKAKAGK